MIKNIKIENYRLFKEFETDALARVNLIVGNNNSGKSSLLEAIHLLTSDDIRASLIYILHGRGEIVPLALDGSEGKWGGYQVAQLFYGRHTKPGKSIDIVSSEPQPSKLRFGIQATVVQRGTETYASPQYNGGAIQTTTAETFPSDLFTIDHTGPQGKIVTEAFPVNDEGILLDNPRYDRRGLVHPKGKSRLLTSNYVGYNELALLWDGITLTPREDRVVEALQILEPTVDRISFTSNRTANSGILLRLQGQKEPIPLGSMGDGMRRILAIVASLVSVEDGTLLVDEIDTGLYHGALVDMWRLVLETAIKQNAQVFATTHSWDCVRAFQQALDQSLNPGVGRLIRLEKYDSKIAAIPYSANELDIAVAQGIEVR